MASTNVGPWSLWMPGRAGATITGVAPIPAQRAKLARLSAAPAGLAIGLGALAVARGPGRYTTYAGRSGLAAALTLAAGLALVLAGLITFLTRRAGRIGDLALLAGFTWFAPVWVGWQVGSPLVRSLGMLTAGFTFPLLFHLVLASPSGKLRSTVTRALVWAVYLEAVLAALGLALFRDPYFDPACWANCTDNVFLLRSLPALARGIQVTDRWFTAAAATALVTVCAWRLLKQPRPSRAALLPTGLPAIVFAAATIAHAVALYRMPLENPADPAFLVIFEIESVAVILLAAGLVWTAVRVTANRRAVARLVTSLGQAPTPGSLEQALARALGDPDLRIAYWLSGSKRYVDATGQPRAEPVATPGRMVTALVEGDRRIAVVCHAAALPELERELGAAVRLGLENERLQAEVLAQLGELRASRARIVDTGDAERRRLERDLHDGAQQRLLALSYDIQLARAAAEADADEQAGLLLEHAVTEVRAGLADLRDLAHGIYPAILAEAGLGPALATLANGASLPVDIQDAPEGRYPAAVETAAYLLVAEALEDAARRGAGYAAVIAVRQDGRLAVTVEDDGRGRVSPMVRINDRVGALGGILRLEPTTIRAEIPCA